MTSDALERIEVLRAEYRQTSLRIRDLEFGPDPAAEDDAASAVEQGYVKDYDLSWLATISSVNPHQGQFLYELARALHARVIVELGTCVGLSAAYLASALSGGEGHVHTVEGGAARAQWAVRTLGRLGLTDRATVHHLRHEAAMVDLVPRIGPIDIGFVDSDHLQDRTVSYFQALRTHISRGGVLVFDDIDWSSGMRRAWLEIRSLAGPDNGVYEWHSFGIWARSAQQWEEAGCESLLSLPR
jgi:predicted O-methyltransferase YrrM